MFSVEFTINGKRDKTTTDATTERIAKPLLTRSLVGADIHWDTFTKPGAKPFVLRAKKEAKPDVHL